MYKKAVVSTNPLNSVLNPPELSAAQGAVLQKRIIIKEAF